MGVGQQPEDVIACKVARELAEEELSGCATVIMNMRRAGGEEDTELSQASRARPPASPRGEDERKGGAPASS